MEELKKYKAFISYRHTEPDMRMASLLQKYLEKKIFKGQERWRVFRDTTEMGASGKGLRNDLVEALENSEYLIVVCSPNTLKSSWVCDMEIQTFMDIHKDRSKILTLLVDGEPQESIPKALWVDGEPPYAVNIAADSIKNSERKLKMEYLRFAATLAGDDFDALYDRKKREQQQKTLAIVTAIAGVVTLLSVSFGLYSRNVNRELEAKNEAINEQLKATEEANGRYIEANENYKKQLEISQLENANNYVLQSEFYADAKKNRDAIENAIKSFEVSEDNTPINIKSMDLLSTQIGAFNEYNNLPVTRIVHDEEVDKLWLVENGKRLVTRDTDGFIYLWDVEKCECIWKSAEYVSVSNMYINDERQLVSTGGLHKINPGLISARPTYISGNLWNDYERIAPEKDLFNSSDRLIIINGNTLIAVDYASGEEREIQNLITDDSYLDKKRRFGIFAGKLCSYSEDGILGEYSSDGETLVRELDLSDKVEFSYKENNILYLEENELIVLNRDNEIVAYNIKDNILNQRRVIWKSNVDEPFVDRELFKYEDYIVIKELALGFMDDRTETLFFLDSNTYEPLWSNTISWDGLSYVNEVGHLEANNIKYDNNVIFHIFGNSITLYDVKKKEIIGLVEYESGIKDYYYTGGIFYVTIESGRVLATGMAGMTGEYYTLLLDDSRSNIELYDYAGGVEAVSERYSRYVDVYRRVENEDITLVFELDNSNISDILEDLNVVTEAKISSDSKHMVVQTSKELIRIDLDTGAQITLDTEEVLEDGTNIFFVDWFIFGDKLWVNKYKSDGYVVIDLNTGEKITEVYVDNHFGEEHTILHKLNKFAYFTNSLDSEAVAAIIICDENNRETIELGGRKINSIFASEDNKFIIADYEFTNNETLERTQQIRVFDVNSKAEIRNIDYQKNGEIVSIEKIALNDERQLLGIVDAKEIDTIQLFDIRTGNNSQIVCPHKKIVDLFMKNNIYIVDANNEILVYDYSGNKVAGIELNDIYQEFSRSGRVNINEINESMISVEYGDKVWFIDTNQWQIIYHISEEALMADIEFKAYDEKRNQVYVSLGEKFWSCPLYSQSELYNKAKALIN